MAEDMLSRDYPPLLIMELLRLVGKGFHEANLCRKRAIGEEGNLSALSVSV